MPDVTLVDPELRPLLASIPAVTLDDAMLAVLREQARTAERSAAGDRERWIDGFEGAPPVRVLVFRPASLDGPAPAILDIHGGGYVMGSPDAYADSYRDRAEALGCVVVAVAYRLAPETPYPGPLDDCYAALRWMHAEAGELGIDARRIGVSGSSAGGGLAAALALRVRGRGDTPVAFQHLLAPMIDDRTAAGPAEPHVGRHVWTADSNRFGWTAYLGREPGGDDVPSLAAVSREQDLAGLPPTYLSVGALDLFLAENLDFASRLARAGVPVEAHVYPGAFHGFAMAAASGVAIRAARDSLDALRILMAGAEPERRAADPARP